MRKYIGLPIDLAVSKARNSGYSTTVKVCDSDKQKVWDAELVVRATLDGDNLTLVSSRFLTKKEKYGE